jgi:hypothetical protein
MTDLVNLVPPIKRARGYRLYDYGGRRYLDLWQNGGYAILGHRFGTLTRVLKSTISRGLIFDLPSIYRRRLLRELEKRYPGFKAFFVFSSLEKALDFVSRVMGKTVSRVDICDPARGESGPVSYDRPFLGTKASGSDALGSSGKPKALLPVFPFKIGASPVILCLGEKPAAAVYGECELSEPVPGESRPFDESSISPLLLAGLLRSIYDLDRFRPPSWYEKPLLHSDAGWIQRGPYIAPRFEAKLYSGVFREFLAEGLLLSPRHEVPSILPGEASDGEMKKMVRLFCKFPKG